MDNDKYEQIKILLENWDKISKISSKRWEKVRDYFSKGKKSIGFIRRKITFNEYFVLSRSEFLKRYARFIIPTEYRWYLLESIVISGLYKKGNSKEGDKKRLELNKINTKALRIYNLYNTGILNLVFHEIDKLMSQNKSDDEITGIISKKLDDLINDKAIIYVNLWDNEAEIYREIKEQLRIKKYCLVHGSGQENVNKIKTIFSNIVDDEEIKDYEIKHNKEKIGGVFHYKLFIFERISISIEEESVNEKGI